MTDMPILAALVPVVVLLALGIATAIGCRALGLSPIVGYIALGIGLKAVGVRMVFETRTIVYPRPESASSAARAPGSTAGGTSSAGRA